MKTLTLNKKSWHYWLAEIGDFRKIGCPCILCADGNPTTESTFYRPSFEAGTRVFFTNYIKQPPLGVVISTDWTDLDDVEIVTVQWDNEVVAVHQAIELRDVEKTIMQLSQQIPQNK